MEKSSQILSKLRKSRLTNGTGGGLVVISFNGQFKPYSHLLPLLPSVLLLFQHLNR